jgi:hypothetical protein
LSSDDGAAAPAGNPHRWQKRAPCISSTPHDAQRELDNEAPHSEQNLPDAAAPQAGQAAFVARDEGVSELIQER